jgi:hypothetical protein
MTNMLARLNNELMANIDAVLPPVGERVIVQSDGFRCVGICDANGRWLDAYNNQALPDVLWFKPLGSRK